MHLMYMLINIFARSLRLRYNICPQLISSSVQCWHFTWMTALFH